MVSLIGDTLFTKSQQRILGLLYGKSDKSFYLNEIVRLADMGKGAIKRELEKMCAAELLTVTRQGNQNHYQANPNNPIFFELKAIVQKTFGVSDCVKSALESLLPALEMVFIYGSIAKGSEGGGSDVDVMLVGDDLSYSGVMTLLEPAETALGRQINPTLYTPKAFSERVNTNQNFITSVIQQPKIWLKGEDSVLLPPGDELNMS